MSSAHNYNDKSDLNAEQSLMGTMISLSIATNAITTMMIAYKLWYVDRCGYDLLDPVAHHRMTSQESPYIHRERSRLGPTKESSADHIDSPRRIGSCLPRIPSQSLFYLAC